jgi:NAD(P)H dehydrogenase (quinone)
LPDPHILLTGVTGRLGPLVLDELLKRGPAADVACIVRPRSQNARAATARLHSLGVEVRHADYDDPASLAPALAGIERLMLVSGSALGARVRQHRNVIEAAKANRIGFIAYTSVLNADRSTLSVGDDHRQTEAMLAASGIPYSVLRNSWYSENLMPLIPDAVAQHQLLGTAGDGRLSTAERADYAAAAAVVIRSDADQGGRIYECAGDEGFTMAEFAAEVSRQTGTEIAYRDLSEGDYHSALIAAGFPAGMAAAFSTSHTAISDGELFNDSHDLSSLIGRPTVPIAATIAKSLGKA